MFDIGWQELLIVGTLAILVIGPKDMPRALRTIMHGIKKLRGVAREFQSGIDDMVREADLDDLKKTLNSVDNGDLSKTISDAVDPDGDLTKHLDMNETQQNLDEIAKTAFNNKSDMDSDNEPETKSGDQPETNQAIEQPSTGTTPSKPEEPEVPSEPEKPSEPEEPVTAKAQNS